MKCAEFLKTGNSERIKNAVNLLKMLKQNSNLLPIHQSTIDFQLALANTENRSSLIHKCSSLCLETLKTGEDIQPAQRGSSIHLYQNL